MKLGALLGWTLVYGVLWNVLGWLGNNLVLAAAWEAVNARLAPDFAPPYSGLTREAMTLVPDFVYAFGFVWIFGQMRAQTKASSIRVALVLELFVLVVYSAMVTSGFLPWPVAAQTSLLALGVFVATAPILPIVRERRSAGRS